MKITGIKTYLVKLPTRRDHNWASKMHTPIGSHVIVRVETDEGLVGWGESPALATWGGAHMMYYGETAVTVTHLVRDYFTPALVGENPLDIGRLHRKMDRLVKGHPYAKAPLDQALYDITGKALGVPVYVLLGGAYRDRIPVAHSLGIMEDAPALAEAEQAAAEGIKVIKVKCGLDPERDVRIVRELRRVLGPSVDIRVDANEGWTSVRQAVRTIRRMQEYGILFAEQPMASLADNADVARQVDVPIMLDESAWTPQDILRMHAARAGELISLYVTKPGGLYRAMQVAHVAEACGLAADIGGSVEMGVGNAANLHLGAAALVAGLASVCPVSQPAEARVTRMAGVYYLDDIIQEPFRYEAGDLLVPQGPGLGIVVDEAKLAKYSL